ncbi:unnamed protein product [Arabis nemorensis]|uniref:Uncharacterized protein n=1 Tax=Arabis nemorensis TaxID=586526 RepID=A0A565B3E2_9BRAS|nr:unnamed protein product [Arabis nemorensis]
MALTVLTWVIMPKSALHGREGWAFCVFYIVAFLLSLFKSSEIQLRVFNNDDGHALPIESVSNQPDGSSTAVRNQLDGSSTAVRTLTSKTCTTVGSEIWTGTGPSSVPPLPAV